MRNSNTAMKSVMKASAASSMPTDGMRSSGGAADFNALTRRASLVVKKTEDKKLSGVDTKFKETERILRRA